MKKSYDDIINLPRHVSSTRPPMPIIDRAAQFAPFAALTGHDAAIKETARVTDIRIALDQDVKDFLSSRLQIIADRIKEQHEVSITYFRPDKKKDGGKYITIVGIVRKIDEYENAIYLEDSTAIPIFEIFNIEGKIFETLMADTFND